jgi:hypothetical protein
MPNPNSPLTRLRFWLAQRIDPTPDKGEGWCVGCALNGGKTLVLNAAGHKEHAREHQEPGHATNIIMRVNFGSVPPSEGP